MKLFAKFKKILSNSEPPEVSDIQDADFTKISLNNADYV